ncbi:MAG: biotin transporter BioY [Methanoregula sp.]|jgi:biotin transport system substrate-specific component|nr:biotin transporter BioY [Methanoregula sp.]
MFGDLDRATVIAYSAAFIGLIALGSWVSIPFVPIPLTLQTLFVLLAGAVMKRRAVIPVTLYLILGMLGLPLFHNGVSGIGVLLGPTGGYIIGFVPAAFLTGLVYERESRKVRIAGLALSTAIIYACGLAWLCWSTGMGLMATAIIGMVPFLPGDAVKLYAAYMIAERLP